MTTEFLVWREMEHVLAALTPPNPFVCRGCVATGLRVGDVGALRTDQLQAQFWFTGQKTRQRRRGGLTHQLLGELLDQAGDVWVFPGSRDPERSHRTRQAVWRDVKRAAKAFRLPQNVGVHSLRKVYAVEQLRKTKGNVARVQRALNHSDAATTMVYAMAYQLYEAKYGGKQNRGAASK